MRSTNNNDETFKEDPQAQLSSLQKPRTDVISKRTAIETKQLQQLSTQSTFNDNKEQRQASKFVANKALEIQSPTPFETQATKEYEELYALAERQESLYNQLSCLSGVPSLWMNKDQLLQEQHVSSDFVIEQQRLDNLLRILNSHKKYENEKYFGGSGFIKRGGQSNSAFNYQLNGMNQEFIVFSTDNLNSKVKGMVKDDKITGQKQDMQEGGANAFPQIRNNENPDIMLFRILQAEAKLVRQILEGHGFQHTEQNDWNILWTCTASQQKSYMYETLNENQKINHFVNSSELTRKDRLCFNVGKMQNKFGRNHFDFLPETYILPDEFSEFYKRFNLIQQEKLNKNVWIVKPASSSQGKGIFMVDDVSEVPLNEQMVISRYIENPLLINGLKFDIRLYVLVTSFEPLKIYIYNEGLVRFASEPYQLTDIKSNAYAHLTNYSINKKSENFVQNKNISQRDFGNKWSLSALQIHLQGLGIDMKIVWERIYDAIIKSILSVESQVYNAMKKIQIVSPNNQGKSNCFDLFGFDIILDENLKPWVLEANLSPSLGFDSPLDYHIKSNLLVDIFNIVGIKKQPRKKEFLGKQIKLKSQPSNQAADSKKRYQSALNMSNANEYQNPNMSKTDTSAILMMNKQNQRGVENTISKNQYDGIDISLIEKLSKVSAKHRELLREHLEEFSRNYKNNFTRVYPAPGTNSYDIFFEQPRPLNKLLYKYLYQSTDFSDIVAQIVPKIDHQHHTRNSTIGLKDSLNGISSSNQISQTKILAPYDTKTQNQEKDRHSSLSSYSISQTNLQKYKAVNDSLVDKGETLQTMSSPLSRRVIDDRGSLTNNKKSEVEPIIQSQMDSLVTLDPNKNERVVITGDDILIEYVKRVMVLVQTNQNEISLQTIKRLESFLNHKVWFSRGQQNRNESLQLWQKIESKFIEMQERKKRLFIKKQKTSDTQTSQQYEAQFLSQERQKDEIIKDFSSNELEQMLIQSNNNNQIEVVSILLCGSNTMNGSSSFNAGILTRIDKETSRLSKNNSQLLKLTKINQDNSFIDTESQNRTQDQSYATPKGYNKRESNALMRMKTSDDTVDTNPFKYNTQQNNTEHLQTSYSQAKTGQIIKNSVLYHSSNVSSNQNLKKSIRANQTVERDLTSKPSDKRITLPSINNNHLSQDYSRVSVQINQGHEASDKSQKYRSRIGGNQLQSSHEKKRKQQSLQNEKVFVSASKFTKMTGKSAKFEKTDF